MLGSIALDVAIGLIFIYILYSLLASTINELIASVFNWRGKTLRKAIKRMLDDGGRAILTTDFYATPLIKYLGEYRGKKTEKNGKKVELVKRPSYLQPRNFSKAVTDILYTEGIKNSNSVLAEGDKLSVIKNGLRSYREKKGLEDPKGQFKSDTVDFIESLLRDADNDLTRFQTSLEIWFNDTMERASGWYKRKTQNSIFIIGLLLAIIFNVNTLGIVKILCNDDDIRKEIAKMAVETFQPKSATPDKKDTAKKQADTTRKTSVSGLHTASEDKKNGSADSVRTALNNAENAYLEVSKVNDVLGAGWNYKARAEYKKHGFTPWGLSIIGWLITATAISLGAPFWFDLLSKFVNLRGAEKNAGTPAGDANKTKSA